LADELKIERAGRQRAEELLVKQVRSACRNITPSIPWLVSCGADHRCCRRRTWS
jgi:hypothetical protein